MNGLTISCPSCDGPVVKVAGARPDPCVGSLIFRCEPCRQTWQFSAVITPVNDVRLQKLTAADLGTYRGTAV